MSGPATARRSRVLAVASGKGGVGKTWFATALSCALARRGRRVLLIDGDLGLANVDVQLGLMPAHDLGSVLEERCSLREAAIDFEPGGFTVLAGRSGSGALATLAPEPLEALLARAACELAPEIIVLDLGAGLDRIVRHLAGAADTLLAVATEEPTSLTDAYALLKVSAAAAPAGDHRVVVNQASSLATGERTYETLARACLAFLHRRPKLAGIIRRDRCVPEAIRRQTLLQVRHPNCAAAQDVERLAGAL